MPQAPQTEIIIPFSDKFDPTPPVNEVGQQVVDAQYGIFCAEKPDFNPDAPIEQKQRALFRLFEVGQIEDIGEVAESWFGGRKSGEWTDEEFNLLKENLPPTAANELRRIASQRALVKHNKGLAAAQTK
ncbi:hypothetical protein COX59_02385 [Candidatus Beckwithbacteria bacterium CG_4_10_14_0_2_um_filter_47_25]|uniref:Uncharacterized protein n=1 Tax=Candidatus Beckwithbacteria bacterium CG_4_10_14_0_2_um_filter_47_25 TaxID=1974493 RepID=A0A2M7W6B4_9BACT|nr:MAG: hypothetical protein COX59_02385 [Candidatus Beckwithbacteria bacterium CG_4_10_14_0_2_um_filter_47_25]